MIASAQGSLEQQIVVLNRRDGQPGAVLCAIPFLRPRDLLTSRAGESGAQKQQALQEAIAEHYQALYQAACERRERLGLPLPIVATGHLTTVGVTTSDSVRDIYIGTLDAFPAQAFPLPITSRWATFTARKTSPSRNIFAIAVHRFRSASMNWAKPKASSSVDFADGTLQQVEALTIPQFQPMQLIKGDLAEIERQLQQFADYAGELPVWLDIEVATQDYLSDIQRRIQLMADELPVEVVLLRRSKEQRRQAIAQQDKETLNELSVNEVFERRLAQEADMPEARQRRMHQLFRQVVDAVQHNPEETHP